MAETGYACWMEKLSSSSDGMTGAREVLGVHAYVLKQVVSLPWMLPRHLLQMSLLRWRWGHGMAGFAKTRGHPVITCDLWK